MYQVLLKAIKETESEYGEGRAMTQAKSATGIAELKDKIEALTTVVRSSNVISAGMKPPGSLKLKHRNFHKFQWKDGMIPSNSLLKSKGSLTSAAGPFKEGQKLIQCYNCGGWGHGWRNCPTTGNVDWRSLNRAKPPPTGNILAPNQTQSYSRKKWDSGGGREYYNPDPLYQLIGPTNETEVNIEGVGIKALIDSRAQISAISKSMVKTLGLPIRKLEALLDIEGSAGSDVPYFGYTELRLDIPEIAKFDHDVLMMVYPDSIYSHRVPVIIGTLHIDEALDLATYNELASLSRGWKRGIFGCRIIAKQLSLKGPVSEPMIHKIGGNVKLTKVITVAP